MDYYYFFIIKYFDKDFFSLFSLIRERVVAQKKIKYWVFFSPLLS